MKIVAKLKISFTLLLISVVISCSIDDSKKNYEKDIDISYRKGRYEVKSKIGKQVLNDTIWYYSDSMLTQLEGIVTYVKIGENFKANQIIKFVDNKCDSSRSIFYKIKRMNLDSISFYFHSKYRDSVSLVLGDFDESYNDAKHIDTFNLTSRENKILSKEFYKRGKLNIYRNVDSIYQGLGLYITNEDLTHE